MGQMALEPKALLVEEIRVSVLLGAPKGEMKWALFYNDKDEAIALTKSRLVNKSLEPDPQPTERRTALEWSDSTTLHPMFSILTPTRSWAHACTEGSLASFFFLLPHPHPHVLSSPSPGRHWTRGNILRYKLGLNEEQRSSKNLILVVFFT